MYWVSVRPLNYVLGQHTAPQLQTVLTLCTKIDAVKGLGVLANLCSKNSLHVNTYIHMYSVGTACKCVKVVDNLVVGVHSRGSSGGRSQ